MAIYPNGRWRPMLWQNWMNLFPLPRIVRFWWYGVAFPALRPQLKQYLKIIKKEAA